MKRYQHATSLFQLAFLATLVFLGTALWGQSGYAAADRLTRPVAQAEATATPGGEQGQPPQPAGTAAPGAVSTAEAGTVSPPDAVATSAAETAEAANTGSSAPPSDRPSDNPSDNPSGNTSGDTSGAAQPGTQTAPASGGVSWPLILIGVAALVAIIAAFLVLSRRRPMTEAQLTTVTSAAPAAGGVQPYVPGTPAATSTVRTTTTTTTTRETLPPPPPASTVTSVSAPVPVTATDLPSTLECPNCGTPNAFDENYCHECGQDLRPLRASMMATVAPAVSSATATAAAAGGAAAVADMVGDDIPYLETLDRIDEQLEYVLSRPTINIGTAPTNDIVIDQSFAGWESVSPTHAVLQQEGDGGFVVTDKSSEHGTFVNDVRTGENLLADGDVLRIGSVRFIFHVPSP